MSRTLFTVVVLQSCLATAQWSAAQSPAPIRLTVEDAVARGLASSHRLAEGRAREEGAEAARRGAQVADRPIISASAGYSRTNHVPEFAFVQPSGARQVVFPDIPDNVVSRLSFQWPIYTSGRADALERAATAEAQAVAADIEITRADLRLEIVRAYWAVATAREAVRVLEESSTRAEALLNDARRRFEVGLVPPNEVSSLEAQRSRERAQLIEARNVRESALIDLRRLMGADPAAVVELSDKLDGVAAGPTARVADPGAIEAALSQRPERLALRFRLGGLEARQQAAHTATKPTVGLAAGVDYANPNPRIFPRSEKWQDSWDVSVNVNWTLWDAGRAKAQVAEAAAAATAVRERMAEFDSVVSADIRQRLLDLDSGMATIQAATDAVRSAAEARRIVSDRFNAGVATSTDVIVAQVALLETELARTRALANVRLAEARLERAMGKS